VSHRILQIVVGRDDNVLALCDEGEKLYPKWSSGNVRKVYREVNKLKHKRKPFWNGETSLTKTPSPPWVKCSI
jgi:hypothetical protein